MRFFLALIFTISIFNTCIAQETNLALKLKKGETYRQNTNSTVHINQQLNGQDLNIIMTVKGTMLFQVTAINGDNYEMDASFEKLGMVMEMPQATMDFNSEKNDESDVFSSMLAAMKGKTFGLLMNKNGKVKDVKNVDNLWGDAIDQFNQLPEMQREQMKSQILKAYGAEALKGNIEMVTAIFPDKPVKKGAVWNIQTKLESGMSAIMNTAYQLVETKPEYSLIKGNSTIKTEDKDAYIETNGVPMRYNMNGTMTSEIKVDKNTGWILDATIHQDMEGSVIIKENPQMPNGMNIPMTMKSEMLISNK